MIAKKLFAAADLNESFELIWLHNLNNSDVVPTWYDDNGVKRLDGDLLSVDNANQITLRCGEAITGTHKLLLSYDSAGVSTVGKRLFEQTINDDPDTQNRISFGKAETPTGNMTIANFIAYLFSKLTFAKRENNLSDLTNAATARSNIGVYSSTSVDQLVNSKASLYAAGTGAVLGIANTASYDPTASYHPATKKYVDDQGRMLLSGRVIGQSSGAPTFSKFKGTLSATTANVSGWLRVIHNYGSLDYYVIASAEALPFYDVNLGTIVKTSTYFEINILRAGAAQVGTYVFEMKPTA